MMEWGGLGRGRGGWCVGIRYCRGEQYLFNVLCWVLVYVQRVLIVIMSKNGRVRVC